MTAWRACWWCGQALHDDEDELCAEHDDVADHVEPDPDRPDLLKGFDDAGIAALAGHFVEVHVEQLEVLAAAWARDHDLDPTAAGAYVGAAIGAARRRLPDVVAQHAQVVAVERRLRRQRQYARLVALARGRAA